MTRKIINHISYNAGEMNQTVEPSRNNDVAVMRDENIVEVGVYKSASETNAGVKIIFECPLLAQKAYVAISQHYSSGRKNNGVLQQAVIDENVTPELVSAIIDRSFAKRKPMFCPL